MSVRVAGTDPGTSSLDVLVLQDGAVTDQARFTPAEMSADPARPVRWLEARGPFDLVAGPSGYGLPLVRGRDCGEAQRRLKSTRARARGFHGTRRAATAAATAKAG